MCLLSLNSLSGAQDAAAGAIPYSHTHSPNLQCSIGDSNARKKEKRKVMKKIKEKQNNNKKRNEEL